MVPAGFENAGVPGSPPGVPIGESRPTTPPRADCAGRCSFLWGPRNRAVGGQRGRCVLENPLRARLERTPLELGPPAARLASWR